jgi:hypothetical protein
MERRGHRPPRQRTRRTPSDLVLTRLVNPMVRRTLKSPLHHLMSDGVALLEYTGRRSGRSLAVPVSYVPDDGAVVLVSRVRRRWWRNFRRPSAVTLTLRGRPWRGRAIVLDASPEEIADVLTRLSARVGHRLSDSRAAAMAADRVVVRVELEPADEAAPPVRIRRWPLRGRRSCPGDRTSAASRAHGRS